jgi:hypothetical protein
MGALLREGSVRSFAEIDIREGITRARVSQLWSLREITREQADEALTETMGKRLSLRRLIKIARNPDQEKETPNRENTDLGN